MWETVGEFILYATDEEKTKMKNIFDSIQENRLEILKQIASFNRSSIIYIQRSL